MRVIVAGDFAPRARLAKQIEEKKFSEIFSEDLRKIVKTADFSFVNFESPVIDNCFKPIVKCGPNLGCSTEAAEAVKYAGFTGVTMANNHILDYGIEGIKKTVDTCRAHGLDIVGVGENIVDAAKVLYLEKDGITIAVLNCCEHEFSIATNNESGANPLNPVQQFYQIQEARSNADFVLVIVHGGHEHYQLPSPRMKETYHYFIDIGADAVVNHHQHCYSGFEKYRGKLIVYGLGNFCFDSTVIKSGSKWNYGYMVEISFGNEINHKIYPYHQYGERPTIELLCQNAFDEKLKQLNDIIIDDNRLDNEVTEYYNLCAETENLYIEPYSGRVFGKLFRLGLIPSFIKGKKASAILNHVQCESHRDKLLYALKKKIN